MQPWEPRDDDPEDHWPHHRSPQLGQQLYPVRQEIIDPISPHRNLSSWLRKGYPGPSSIQNHIWNESTLPGSK